MTKTTSPGAMMTAEIAQQAAVWRRIADAIDNDIARAAASAKKYCPRFVLLTARGTSDHAALYAKYLIEIRLGLPCGLVSPSTMTAYSSKPELKDVLMLSISQSGGSPDLVRSLEVARSSGALTIAVTNKDDSPLALAAHEHVDVLAGPERAVAATKSYTAELLTLHLLLSAVSDLGDAPIDRLCDAGEQLINNDAEVELLAQRYRFASRFVTTARGYSYATARESALKLMETCYVSAQAFSGADLLHGPLAMIDQHVPVLMTASAGIGGAAMRQVTARLAGRHADVFCVGNTEAVAAAKSGIVLPPGIPEELSPLLEIIPFQQLALHTALARGEDPDAPRGLSKVTETL